MPGRLAAGRCGSTPTIGSVIAAGLPWLTLSCPACGQCGSVDLRTLDRHPGGAISGLIPSLSCRRCSPNAPFARLEMLTAERPWRIGPVSIALAIIAQVVTSCADQERFRGRSSDQVKQACDPQRQTPEERSRTLDK